jgi:hypothetical protein
MKQPLTNLQRIEKARELDAETIEARYARLNAEAEADYTVEGMTPEEVYLADQRQAVRTCPSACPGDHS